MRKPPGHAIVRVLSNIVCVIHYSSDDTLN